MHDMQIRNPVVCDASKVSLYKKITTICLIALCPGPHQN